MPHSDSVLAPAHQPDLAPAKRRIRACRQRNEPKRESDGQWLPQRHRLQSSGVLVGAEHGQRGQQEYREEDGGRYHGEENWRPGSGRSEKEKAGSAPGGHRFQLAGARPESIELVNWAAVATWPESGAPAATTGSTSTGTGQWASSRAVTLS